MNSFERGFIKRAQEKGASEAQAKALMKQADFGGMLQNAGNFVVDKAKGAVDGIGNYVKGIGSGLKDGFRSNRYQDVTKQQLPESGMAGADPSFMKERDKLNFLLGDHQALDIPNKASSSNVEELLKNISDRNLGRGLNKFDSDGLRGLAEGSFQTTYDQGLSGSAATRGLLGGAAGAGLGHMAGPKGGRAGLIAKLIGGLTGFGAGTASAFSKGNRDHFTQLANQNSENSLNKVLPELQKQHTKMYADNVQHLLNKDILNSPQIPQAFKNKLTSGGIVDINQAINMLPEFAPSGTSEKIQPLLRALNPGNATGAKTMFD